MSPPRGSSPKASCRRSRSQCRPTAYGATARAMSAIPARISSAGSSRRFRPLRGSSARRSPRSPRCSSPASAWAASERSGSPANIRAWSPPPPRTPQSPTPPSSNSLIAEPRTDWSSGPADRSVVEALAGADAPLPPIRFDCGLADPYLEANRRLHRKLEALGIAHVYEEAEGGHDWSYWSRQLEQSLRFFGRVLARGRHGS